MFQKQKNLILKLFITSLLLLFLLSCGMSVYTGVSPNNRSENNSLINSDSNISRSISSPGDAKYVGDGFDMLKLSSFPNDAFVGKCITDMEILRTVGDSKTTSNNYLVEDSFKMELNLNFKCSSSAEITLFEKLNASNQFNLDIVNNTKFSTNTIAMMGVVEYYDSTVLINSAKMTEESLLLYNTDPIAFEQRYGSGFCNKVQLGEKLIVIFSYTFNDFNNYSKVDFSNTAKAHFAEIFKGESSVSTTMDMNYFKSHTEIQSQVYSTGKYIPDPVFSREDFIKTYNNWIQFTNLKLSNPSADLSVISSSYQPYSVIVSQQNNSDLDIYAKMIYEWKKERSKVNIILNDTHNASLIQSCMDCLKVIQQEVDLCLTKDVNARFPRINEFPLIEQAWRDYFKLNIYELNYNQIPLSYYIACKSDDFTNKFNDLKLQKGDDWKFIQEVTEVYPIQLENTVPVYQLEDASSQKSLFLSTDYNKYQLALVDYSYTPLASGIIMGYIDKDDVKFDALNQQASAVYQTKSFGYVDKNWNEGFIFIKSLTLNNDSYIWAKYYYKQSSSASYKYLGSYNFGEFNSGDKVSFYMDTHGNLFTQDRVEAKVSSPNKTKVNYKKISTAFNYCGKVVYYYNDVTKL